MFLSDLQWEMVRPYLPTPPTGPHKRGRPIQDTRMVLEGILWVLKSGARWRDCLIRPKMTGASDPK